MPKIVNDDEAEEGSESSHTTESEGEGRTISSSEESEEEEDVPSSSSSDSSGDASSISSASTVYADSDEDEILKPRVHGRRCARTNPKKREYDDARAELVRASETYRVAKRAMLVKHT